MLELSVLSLTGVRDATEQYQSTAGVCWWLFRLSLCISDFSCDSNPVIINATTFNRLQTSTK